MAHKCANLSVQCGTVLNTALRVSSLARTSAGLSDDKRPSVICRGNELVVMIRLWPTAAVSAAVLAIIIALGGFAYYSSTKIHDQPEIPMHVRDALSRECLHWSSADKLAEAYKAGTGNFVRLCAG
jgi:hypothetical protein